MAKQVNMFVFGAKIAINNCLYIFYIKVFRMWCAHFQI